MPVVRAVHLATPSPVGLESSTTDAERHFKSEPGVSSDCRYAEVGHERNGVFL